MGAIFHPPSSILAVENWERQDSNLRRLSHQIYSLAHLTTLVRSRTWVRDETRRLAATANREHSPEGDSSRRDSNPQPSVYKTDALPVELHEPASQRNPPARRT